MPVKVAFSPVYIHPVPENHRFPMEKYQLIYEQLQRENILSGDSFFIPGVISDEDVLLVHEAAYLEKLKALECSPREQRASGFVHTAQLIERELIIMEGTRKCAELALEHGIALNIAGGTHHAYANRGEGFCLLNDQAIAAAWLLREKLAERIAIIDLDVHQGNGTASIFGHESRVFTFSMHGAANYPLKKEVSDLDIGLADNCGDAEYLGQLRSNLAEIMESFRPDFLFYQCGVDVLATDKLGRLGLSPDGCRERDDTVLKAAKTAGVPVVCSMGGGYGPNMRAIVEAHINTFRIAARLFD
jgi:acetoin utilization deacetylase AcuC-like enzyme